MPPPEGCIASIVLIDAYLIIVEDICDSYVRQLGLTERPGMDFLTLIRPRRQGPSAMTRLTTAVRESVMSRDEEDAPEDGDRR